MLSFVKNIFRRNKKSTSVVDEYDKEAFSKFEEKERLLLLGHFSKVKKEYDLRSLHDESDALIYSLASFVFTIGLLVIPKSFEVPNALFLFTAIFALYFSLVSLLKTGTFKINAMIFSFPFALVATTALTTYGANIDDINNGLSLIALGISLMLIAPQKRKERNQLQLNKLKNDMLLEQDETNRKQEKIIESLQKSLNKFNEIFDQKDGMVEEMDALKNDIEVLLRRSNPSKDDD